MKDASIQFSPTGLRVLQRLDRAPVELQARLMRVVDEQNQYTIAHVQLRFLSYPRDLIGPVDGLRVRTNRLRGSLWAAKARLAGGHLLSSIGTNVNYAGVHEYGFDGQIQVRAFTRKAKALNHYRVLQLQPEIDMSTGRITRRARKKRELVASGIVRVKAHTRHAHYAERAPIRRGIADRIPAYGVALEGAAVAYLAGGVR